MCLQTWACLLLHFNVFTRCCNLWVNERSCFYLWFWFRCSCQFDGWQPLFWPHCLCSRVTKLKLLPFDFTNSWLLLPIAFKPKFVVTIWNHRRKAIGLLVKLIVIQFKYLKCHLILLKWNLQPTDRSFPSSQAVFSDCATKISQQPEIKIVPNYNWCCHGNFHLCASLQTWLYWAEVWIGWLILFVNAPQGSILMHWACEIIHSASDWEVLGPCWTVSPKPIMSFPDKLMRWWLKPYR